MKSHLVIIHLPNTLLKTLCSIKCSKFILRWMTSKTQMQKYTISIHSLLKYHQQSSTCTYIKRFWGLSLCVSAGLDQMKCKDRPWLIPWKSCCSLWIIYQGHDEECIKLLLITFSFFLFYLSYTCWDMWVWLSLSWHYSLFSLLWLVKQLAS